MALSCSYDYDPEPGDVCWHWPNAMEALATKRARKCCSCGERIAVGAKAAAFDRWKIPDSAIEEAIYGDDWDSGVPRATWYMCGLCGNIALLLARLNYSFYLSDDMRELAKEHAALSAIGQGGCL